MVRMKDIIGIFDVQVQESPHTTSFANFAQTDGAVEVVEVGDIKSVVVTENKLYYSPISSLTLKKRAHVLSYGAKTDSDFP
jgi:extracellular matrix regulatory protein B